MDKKRMKFIGRLNNYKKYPRVKGARKFTYFDEYYGVYGGGLTDFYPTVGLVAIFLGIFAQMACTLKGIYLGIYFDLGLVLGWILDIFLRLWPVKYYDKIKIGYSFYSGIIFISETPIPITIYKRIERISYWIRTLYFIVFLLLIIYVLMFKLPYLYNYLSLGSACLGAFIPIVSPVYRGSANYRKLKRASDDLLLVHHNGGTYSLPKD